MPGVEPGSGVNCMVGRLPVGWAGVAVSGSDFLSDCRVFAMHGHRFDKAESYHRRRSRGNGVPIGRYR